MNKNVADPDSANKFDLFFVTYIYIILGELWSSCLLGSVTVSTLFLKGYIYFAASLLDKQGKRPIKCLCTSHLLTNNLMEP